MVSRWNPGTARQNSLIVLKALWAQRPTRSAKSSESELVIDGRMVIWRRSARRKRSLALKLDRRGQLIAMTPLRVTVRELKAFLRSRSDWIEWQTAQHAEVEARRAADAGRRLYFMGDRLEVVQVTARRNFVSQVGQTLQLGSSRPPGDAQLHRRLVAWLREQAEDELPGRLACLSEETGLLASGWPLKTYTARWGSCRHDGVIQLNWKLIKAPPEVIDYVILHELCHLRFFNHSTDFWQLVASYRPDYQQQRQWLKQNGRLLLDAAH